MNLYQHFSEVYDLFISDYEWCLRFIKETIREYADNPRSLLELACGTGNLLQHFIDEYEISGIDISASMLAQAKKKLPNVPLFEMNMADFKLNRKFDLIICMFDSINHLLSYEDWLKTFSCVRNHLNPGGVFMFDMNTLERLDRISQSPGFMQQKDDVYLNMKVTKIDENAWNWNVKIFKRVRDNLYELNEDNIKEASFSLQKVKQDLEMSFGKVRIRTYEDGPNSVIGRTFFICQS